MPGARRADGNRPGRKQLRANCHLSLQKAQMQMAGARRKGIASSEKLLDEPSAGRVRSPEGSAHRHCLTQNHGAHPSIESDLDSETLHVTQRNVGARFFRTPKFGSLPESLKPMIHDLPPRTFHLRSQTHQSHRLSKAPLPLGVHLNNFSQLQPKERCSVLPIRLPEQDRIAARSTRG